MNKPSCLLPKIFRFVSLIFLVLVLVFLFQWTRENLITKNSFTAGSESYPLPGEAQATSVQQLPPATYPEPEDPNDLTPVVQNTPEPMPTLEPMPPPGWPPNQPWPPIENNLTPVPTTLLEPFPTINYLHLLNEESFPDKLQIWFPYYPKTDVQPSLWEVILDRESGQAKTKQLPINLPISIPMSGPDPGPVLLEIHLSPDSRWLVADFAYRGSQIVDLFSGNTRDLANNFESAYWKFFTWIPSDPFKLIVSDQEYPTGKVQLVNLDANQSELIPFSENIEKDAMLRTMAYSPDGEDLSVAVILPAKLGSRKTEVALVRLEGDEIQTLAEIKSGVSFVDNSLQWSPDGEKLAWIVKVINENGEYETQLWMADLKTGSVKTLDVLGKSVKYNHPPVWSPDGLSIAFLKAKLNETGFNVFVINLETGGEKQITNFIYAQLSHLKWVPNGKWLTFTISMGEYGEIWAANLEGSFVSPFAGPTLPDSPYIIITADE